MSSDKNPKRALPYWMSARDDGNRDKQVDDTPDVNNQVETSNKTVRGRGKEPKDNGEASERKKKLEFSKLLVLIWTGRCGFVLSGFVNPERGMLRSQALEMGAEYQPDWNSNCTLLVCAFPNTPKFRQVEADGGTIVSKNWITECYTQKKLLDIETYLMHIGKPWRKNNITHTGNEVCETPQPNKKSHKKEVKGPEVEPNAFYSAKELTGNTSICFKDKFPASKVKKWALDDFNRTLTWLESQEKKPEPSEIRSVAAEGILTCLQDTIDLLESEQDLQNLTEQWNMVPHVVEELIGLQSTDTPSSISKDGLHKQALLCKKVYEGELKGMISSGSNEKNEDPKCKSRNTGKGKHSSTDEFVRHPNLKKKSHKEEVKGPEVEPNAFYSAKELTGNTSICFKDKFPASKVEKWAFDDFNRTLTWLESQEEKPEPSEIRSVAAEGILTCLQDTIDLLESEQDLQNLTAQWNMVPHVVEELIGLQSTDTSSISKDGLHKQALLCKKIYEGELNGMVSSGSNEKNEEPKCKSCNTGKGKHSSTDEVGCNLKDYDSDETIEMTEEEINDAYNSLVSKLPSSS